MPFSQSPIVGLQLFEPRVFGDERGYFFESYNQQVFHDAGITTEFVQDNQAMSQKGVLRGMHFQTGEHAQGKLIRAIAGEIYDVAVDIRPNSPTHHQWFGALLSEENQRQLYVPRGFAHGYLVLSETAIVAYKCDNYYATHAEGGLRYDDPAIGIQWPDPCVALTVAERDLQWKMQ